MIRHMKTTKLFDTENGDNINFSNISIQIQNSIFSQMAIICKYQIEQIVKTVNNKEKINGDTGKYWW